MGMATSVRTIIPQEDGELIRPTRWTDALDRRHGLKCWTDVIFYIVFQREPLKHNVWGASSSFSYCFSIGDLKTSGFGSLQLIFLLLFHWSP